MKLIKCTHCGRPYYNEEKACPYCGHSTHLSATNFVTKSISTPQSHKLMEDVLSGNYHPAPKPVHAETPVVAPQPQPEPLPVAEPLPEPEAPIAPEPEAAPEPQSLQGAERAENIAAAAQQQEPVENVLPTDATEDPNEVATTHEPRKRHGWIWILLIVILLALGAAAYLYWDTITNFVSSLLG